MGKISTGCDIVFKFGDEEIARMGSDLSFEQSSLDKVVEILINNEDVKLHLLSKLRYETLTKEVTSDDIENRGVVPNNTLTALVKKYSSLDWEGIDQSIKLFTVERFRYLDKDLTNTIVNLFSKETNKKELIIIINPSDVQAVKRLNEFLIIKRELRNPSARTRAVLDNSDLSSILDVLKEITVQSAEENLKKVQERKNVSERKIVEALLKVKKAKLLNDAHIRDSYDLLEFYLENESFFNDLLYKKDGKYRSVVQELINVCKALQGIDNTKSEYSDSFANEIAQSAKYYSARDCHRVPMPLFLTALQTKLANLEENAKPENEELRSAIKKYLSKPASTREKVKPIVDLLTDDADDEFSYTFIDSDSDYIYFKNVPRILKKRFPEFNWKSIQLLKPQMPYRGFYIYMDPLGRYYYSKHPISEYTWGTRYLTESECQRRIDSRINSEAIAHESLIDFKTRKGDVVFVPNKYIKGQIIRSLDIHFSSNLKLNSEELSLIYDTLSKDNNTLDKFYAYVSNIVKSRHPDRVRLILEQAIDTSEKAACFIYALNELEGLERYLISDAQFDKIISRITAVSHNYEYFIVDEVQQLKKNPSNGFKLYRNITNSNESQRPVYKVTLTKMNSSEIHQSKADYDLNGNPVAVGRLLRDLGDKILLKLNVPVHVESLSDLEARFKEWGLDMPPNTHGFVHEGEIYINMSNASQSDLFHEYTHIMLAILKAKNFDNYYQLITNFGDNLPETVVNNMAKRYPYLAKIDLYEELFADLLGRYLAGNDMDKFLANELSILKKVIDEKLGSIFGTQPMSEEFYNSNMYSIFKQFSYDLGLQMLEDNGIHLKSALEYAEASNWISEQIQEASKEHLDEDGNPIDVGIYENCN